MASIGSPLMDQENVHIQQTPIKQRRAGAFVAVTPLSSLDVNKVAQTPQQRKADRTSYGPNSQRPPPSLSSTSLHNKHETPVKKKDFKDEGTLLGRISPFGRESPPPPEMDTLVSPSKTFRVDFEQRPSTLEWLAEKKQRCTTPEFAPFTGTSPGTPIKISDIFSPTKSPGVRTPPKITVRLCQAFEIKNEKGEAPKPIIPIFKPIAVRPEPILPQFQSLSIDEDDHDEDSEEDANTTVETIDFGQCTSPIKQRSQEISTDALELTESECQTYTTCIGMSDIECQTGIAYAYLIDSSMLTSPVKTADATQIMTPISRQTFGTEMTPLVMVDTSMLTTPGKVSERASSPQNLQTPIKMDGLDAVEGSARVVGDDPVTPVKTAEQDTFMTPVTTRDTSMITSPVGNMALRLSDPVLSNLSPLEMRNQLEMALISNELLRTELVGVQQEQTSRLKQMALQRDEVMNKESEIAALKEAVEQAKVDTKASMQDEISRLEERATNLQNNVLTAEASTESKEKELEVVKCEKNNLQEDLTRMYKQHKQEIADLHADYARKDYKPHFEKAQQVIRKLESQVEIYINLSESIEGAEKVQDNLGTAFNDKYTKLKTMEERIVRERSELDKEQKDFLEHVATNEMAVKTATVSCERMRKECEQMKARLDEANRTLNDSQLYQDEIIMELKMATEKLATMTMELASTKQSLADARGKVNQLEEELRDLSASLEQKDEEIVRLEKSLGREVQNHNDMFKNGPKIPQKQPRETMDFLEEENHLLTDSIKEVEHNLSATRMELSRSQNLLREKTDMCAQLESKVKQLNDKLSSIQAEMDNTKANAHFMLLSQGAELADVSVNISMLKEKMTEFQEKLKVSAARVLKGVQTIPSAQKPAANQENAISFVSSLLKAADGKDPKQNKSLNHSTTDRSSDSMHLDSDDSGRVSIDGEPNNNLLGSSRSAFAKVTPAKGLAERGEGVGSEDISAFVPVTGNRSLSEDSMMNSTRLEAQDMSLSTSCSEEKEPTIKDEVDYVLRVLDVIVDLVSACDQARDRMLHTIQQENQQLLGELEMRQSGREDLSRLKKSVEESERDQIAVNVKLLEKAEELEECQAVLADMRLKCNELSQQLVRHTDQDKVVSGIQEELEQALGDIRHLKSEKEVLERQLQNTLKALDTDDSVEVSRGKYLRDVMALQKELHQVKEKYIEKEESYKELKDKASRRMTVLEQNWKLAEDEVFRMDGLIEHIRTTLHENATAMTSCAALCGLIKELDGDDAGNSAANSR